MEIQWLGFYRINGRKSYHSLFTVIYRGVKIDSFTFIENHQSLKEFAQGAQLSTLISYLKFILRIEFPFFYYYILFFFLLSFRMGRFASLMNTPENRENFKARYNIPVGVEIEHCHLRE